MANQAVYRLFTQINADMQGILRRAPLPMGRIAINFMEDNFEKGGFQDKEGGLTKWPMRKHDDGSGRAILMGKQSGRLMKSGTIFQADMKAVVVGVPDDIAVYGRVHNEGGTTHPRVTERMKKFAWIMYSKEGGAWKPGSKKRGSGQGSQGGKQESERASFWKSLALTKKTSLTVNIPKRQFLGNSPELNRRLGAYFINAFKESLRSNSVIK